MSYSLADIAQKIGATVVCSGDQDPLQIQIEKLATIARAQPGQVTFLANSKYRQFLTTTQASAVILAPEFVEECQTNALVMENPYLGYSILARLLDDTPATAANGIHPSAVVSETAVLGKGVNIGANAVIEAGVNLEDNVCIGAGCFVGQQAHIGANTSLWANVTVYHKVIIGQNCLVQSNTVIGSDGFGYAKEQGNWVKIPQLGSVVIGDRVEIGASTTIDRGALEDTIIKDGVILDNQIQIAHNVIIGENTAMAACSVVAGSTVIGKNCSFSGQCGINGHIEIVDGCMFTGQSMIAKSITEPGVYSSGIPVMANKEWNKITVRIKQLESLNKRVQTLEKAK